MRNRVPYLGRMNLRLVVRRSWIRSSGLAHSFVETGHVIISMAILSLLLIQVGLGLHLALVNRLVSLPRNMVRLTDGTPYVPQLPGYLKTHIIIIIEMRIIAYFINFDWPPLFSLSQSLEPGLCNQIAICILRKYQQIWTHRYPQTSETIFP